MIYRSPLPAPPVPEVALTPFVLERAMDQAGEAAFVDAASGRSVSYGQLAMGTAMAAGGWRARGLHKGDVVALYMPNIPEYAAIFHTVSLAGGVCALFSPLLGPEELHRCCRLVGARWIVTVGPLVPAAAATGLEVIGVGEAPGTTPFLSLLADPLPPVELDPATDLVALAMSSGTEGLPKPVMITHRNLVASVVQIEALGQFSRADTFLGLLPFTHVYGALVGLCLPPRIGARVVTMIRFEIFGFLRALSEHRVSVAHLVPPLVRALAEHPAAAEHDLSNLRGIVSGGAPLPAALGAACAARLGCYVVDGYGLTESLATHVVHDYQDGRHLGTVGAPLPLVECRVVDPETGEELPPGASGEILVSGPTVTRGYLGDPEASARLVDGEGWLHTGDLGHVDAEGRLVVEDRLKELIKCAGVSIAPASLEAVLRAHPDVLDAAVTGRPDAFFGEVPHGWVVLARPLAPAELLAWAAARVPPDQRLRGLDIVDAIPRSLAGKLLRRELRARASNPHAQEPS